MIIYLLLLIILHITNQYKSQLMHQNFQIELLIYLFNIMTFLSLLSQNKTYYLYESFSYYYVTF